MDNIRNFEYEIVLSAPIGNKKGILSVNIARDKLEGDLIIMKNENHFCGSVKPDGSCVISGGIKTLIGAVDYHGEGYIDEQTVTLVLNTGKRKFVVSGNRLIKGEA
ncbi:MAG: hypothetical protein ACI4JW_02350 [Oscillospiraceae bacterium]